MNVLLLLVGLGLLLHRQALADLVTAERWLREFGVDRDEERRTWSGVVLVGGLALVFTAALRFVV